MKAFVDLTGKRFGKLTVIRREDKKAKDEKHCIKWECKCDCGNTTFVSSGHLKDGHVSSCGCLSRIKRDITGKRFGKLIVISRHNKNSHNGESRWTCKCDCGAIVVKTYHSLNSSKIPCCPSCHRSISKQTAFIMSQGNIKHGMSSSKIYTIWSAMKRRCNNKHDSRYKDYGGRGIKVCQRWKSFVNFYEDMGKGYRENLQIDRINNDGNYDPGNCHWVTLKENCNHRRTSVTVTIGRVSKTMREWSDAKGISAGSFHTYLRHHRLDGNIIISGGILDNTDELERRCPIE